MSTGTINNPLDTVRIGVVGIRNIGKNHIRHALNAEGAQVVAVADTDAERVKQVADEFSIHQTFSDAADLFRSDSIDAVILALPNHLHAPLTIAALEAGKHVLVEKPIARTVEEADSMIAARDASGKVLMVGMNQRLTPYNSALKKAVNAGAVGCPTTVYTSWLQRRLRLGSWERGAWSLSMESSGGGPLLDLGIHKLDLALYLLDFPKVTSVSGRCFTGIGKREAAACGGNYEIEDSAIGVVYFDNGSVLTLEASYFQNVPHDGQCIRIHGDRGSLYAPGDQPIHEYRNGEAIAVPFEPDSSAAGSCAGHFVRVLRGTEALIPTAEQAREGLKIIRAIYASADSGHPVDFTK